MDALLCAVVCHHGCSRIAPIPVNPTLWCVYYFLFFEKENRSLFCFRRFLLSFFFFTKKVRLNSL